MNVEPPPIPLIKSKNIKKLDKDCVEIKLRRDPKSQQSDLYELKMYLFDNGELEEFLLLIRNFNMTLKASGTILDGTKIQYLRTLVHGELCQFDTLFDEVGSTTSENLTYIIFGLGTYFPLLISCQKKKRCAVE